MGDWRMRVAGDRQTDQRGPVGGRGRWTDRRGQAGDQQRRTGKRAGKRDNLTGK